MASPNFAFHSEHDTNSGVFETPRTHTLRQRLGHTGLIVPVDSNGNGYGIFVPPEAFIGTVATHREHSADLARALMADQDRVIAEAVEAGIPVDDDLLPAA